MKPRNKTLRYAAGAVLIFMGSAIGLSLIFLLIHGV